MEPPSISVPANTVSNLSGFDMWENDDAWGCRDWGDCSICGSKYEITSHSDTGIAFDVACACPCGAPEHAFRFVLGIDATEGEGA